MNERTGSGACQVTLNPSDMDKSHYRPLFRSQDDGFIGIQAPFIENSDNDPGLLTQVEAAVGHLQHGNSDGLLLLPIDAAQMCNGSLMTELLDRLLKLRFSWRNIVLLIHQLPTSISKELFNQSAYKLHQCQFQIWLESPLLPILMQLPELLLVDAIYFDYQQDAAHSQWDSEMIQRLLDNGIDFVLAEPPLELDTEMFPFPLRLVLTSGS
ncbi:hypothetical protein [Celerinatantimonas sp. YJH-8]|uniref:hypothetical protein n=1 Tax=Celerinatantimonas sp. YJH-8 TaxID=3228714 RepID=UPI0038C99CD0